MVAGPGAPACTHDISGGGNIDARTQGEAHAAVVVVKHPAHGINMLPFSSVEGAVGRLGSCSAPF